MENTPTLMQSERMNAPWNDEGNKPLDVEVTVSLTISKTLKVPVDDYIKCPMEKDDDGVLQQDIDFSECDFYNAVKSNKVLPVNLAKSIKKYFDYLNKKGIKTPESYNQILNDCSGWEVDDFEVIPE